MLIDIDSPIKSVAFGKVKHTCGAWHSGRNIPYFLLVYCINGSFRMRIEGDVYDMQTGDVLLIPANTDYVPLDSDGCSYYFLHFSAKYASKSCRRLRIDHGAILPEGSYHYQYADDSAAAIEIDIHTRLADSGTVSEIFSRIAALDLHRNSAHKLLMDNLLREILISISRELSENTEKSKHTIRITDYIKANYKKKLSLSSLSSEFSLSEVYIAKLFSTELGMRPSEYINSIRVSYARDMLIHTDMPIGEIAETVGFSSLYYFSRVFKKICAISPSDFRNGKAI